MRNSLASGCGAINRLLVRSVSEKMSEQTRAHNAAACPCGSPSLLARIPDPTPLQIRHQLSGARLVSVAHYVVI